MEYCGKEERVLDQLGPSWSKVLFPRPYWDQLGPSSHRTPRTPDSKHGRVLWVEAAVEGLKGLPEEPGDGNCGSERGTLG